MTRDEYRDKALRALSSARRLLADGDRDGAGNRARCWAIPTPLITGVDTKPVRSTLSAHCKRPGEANRRWPAGWDNGHGR